MKALFCTLFLFVIYACMILQSIYVNPKRIVSIRFLEQPRDHMIYSNTMVDDLFQEYSLLYDIPKQYLRFYAYDHQGPFSHERVLLKPTEFLYPATSLTHWSVEVKPTPEEHYLIYTLNAPVVQNQWVECHANGICKITPDQDCHGLCINTLLLFQDTIRPKKIEFNNKSIPYHDHFWLPESTFFYRFL